MTGLLIALMIAIPWGGALIALLIGDQRPNWQHRFAVGVSAAAAGVALVMLGHTGPGVALSFPMGAFFGDFTFVADGLGVFLTAVAAVIGCLAVVFSVDYMQGEANLSRYYAFVLIFIGAMAGLVLTGSLLLLFVFWEITALCSFGLIAFDSDNPDAAAGGLRALVITGLGGVGLLIGGLVTYNYTGSYQIEALLSQSGGLPVDVLALLAFGFLLAAAAKSAQVPFHTWLPGAMEAPTPISALIHAATMVNAGVYLLARFYPAFVNVPGWADAVMAVGLASALVAGLMALVAHDLKRVLAYSTISQLGYMVFAVGAGALFASQFHLLSHAIFKALLFLGAGAIIHNVGTRDMYRMGGLGKEMPFVRNVFIIGALALAGVPIFNGFWSKEMILEHTLAEGHTLHFILLIVGAALTALYTARMLWYVFFAPPAEERHLHPTGSLMKLALAPLALGVLVTWLLVEPFGELLDTGMQHFPLHTVTLGEMVGDVIAAPATWFAVVLVLIGLLGWRLISDKSGLIHLLNPVAGRDFGFTAINRGLVGIASASSNWLAALHTGNLNLNALGLVAAVAVVLLVLLGGGA